MKIQRIGFIGAGRMGSALARGIISSGFANLEDTYIFDVSATAVESLALQTGAQVAGSIAELVDLCDVTVLAVKPQVIDGVIEEVERSFTKDDLLISIIAGVTTVRLESSLPQGSRVVRAMPNAPAMVGAGMAAVCAGADATHEDVGFAVGLLASVGESVVVEESLIDAVTAISGSGPAYFFLLVEAMMAAGCEQGLKTEVAAKLVSQTFFGSAKMLVDTGESPMDLRAMITSPGGTTEAALNIYKKEGFENMVSKAVEAAVGRARELGGTSR